MIIEAQSLRVVLVVPAGRALACICSEHIIHRDIDEIDIDDEDTGARTKNKCITAFGGSKYESFCTTALGF